ncbi:hypothetical protein ACR6HW_06290 [Fusibacter sp. JL298sf-3]
MICHINNEVILYPIASNVLFNSFKRDSLTCRFSTSVYLRDSDVIELINRIEDVINKYEFIGIDLEYVTNADSRAFSKFSILTAVEKIVFINVDKNSIVKQKIFEDLNSFGLEVRNDMITFGKNNNFGVDFKEKFKTVYGDNFKKIIATYAIPGSEYLNSSSVWSNHYVDFKKMFMHSENLKIILYEMTKITNEYGNSFDGIISSSKTGSIFATLIGYLLNRKVIHYISIGPKFAITEKNMMKKIRAKKKYLYVGDFICLGTELKTLNVLLANNNSEIVGGVVVASYLDLSDAVYKESILSKVRFIARVDECGINYKVAGTKKELEG